MVRTTESCEAERKWCVLLSLARQRERCTTESCKAKREVYY